MHIALQNELTPELTEFLRSFWHDADIEHYEKDSGWQSESLIFLAYEDEIKDPDEKTQTLPNHYLKKDWVEYTKFL